MMMLRVFIPIIALFAPVVICNAQQQHDTEALHLDSLIQKLQAALSVKKDIEIQEIKGVYRLTPWHFAPNLNYDFINNNYYVTVSTAPIVANMIGKRQEKRRISAILCIINCLRQRQICCRRQRGHYSALRRRH
jgi:hypothetical protein